jgi:broad specificity phosphatase PhoE
MGSRLDLKNLRDQHRQFYLVVYSPLESDSARTHCGGGLPDEGLSALGKEEAQKLSARLKKNPFKIKRFYTGAELRTVQWADFMHDVIKVQMKALHVLNDQNLGEFEGCPMEAGEDAFTVLSSPRGGETDEVFSIRVRQGLEVLLADSERSLLIAHPRVAKKALEWLGLKGESLNRATLYSLDLPVGQGSPHLREI